MRRTMPTMPTRDCKDASDFTIAANTRVAYQLDFANTDDFADSDEGFVGTWDPLIIKTRDPNVEPEDQRTVWSLEGYEDQVSVEPNERGPLTVNPSLWRQAKINRRNGLFKVVDGIYQVRAFDMSNMTIIEAPDGLIIIDPLISCECAEDALKLYCQHRDPGGSKAVRAVIFTHSHVDHFGGVLGVVTPEQISAGGVDIVAPEGFLEHAVSENVYAGIAMTRRAQYMYGPYLAKGPKGQVDGGLGKGQSVGKVSIVAPTKTIPTAAGELSLKLAGLDVEFHNTPGAEAPAEFDFYFPEMSAFCAAENAVHTMHNIQTLRGARVRDALLWSRYMNEALELYGKRSKVLFASHHWPVWDDKHGTGSVARFLQQQRDMYRYLNDQTLRMLNKGYTGVEIAEVFEMPPSLAKQWSCRGYYGSVSHNVKAVYDRYMGWFDGNPSNLHPLPPHESAPLYVELMGGAETVVDAAERAIQTGKYRWAAELLHKVVFAEPGNERARLFLADALEQLGYQAEAATWRNFYLMGARELREGIPEPQMSTSDPSMTAAMTLEMIFDALAANINGPQAADVGPMTMNWVFTDTGENLIVELSNSALTTTPKKTKESVIVDVTISLARATLDGIMSDEIEPGQAIEDGRIQIQGSQEKLVQFFGLIESGVPDFPIVTPRPDIREAWTGGSATRRAMAKEALRRKLRVLCSLPRGC